MVRLFSLLFLSACTPAPQEVPEKEPVEGLYDTAAVEDGSCRLLDSAGVLFACAELNDYACLVGEGTGVVAEASAERCPEGASATCGEDPDTLWSYYGAADGEHRAAWCEACVSTPVPADFCEPVVTDADGDGVLSDTDCDDADSAVFPGAAETCDGVDQDCSGTADDGVTVENGACDGGVVVCEGGYHAEGESCIAWRDAWLGEYTFTQGCGGEAGPGGSATFSALGEAPTDILVDIPEVTTFGIVLTDADTGTAPDVAATVSRDPGTGVILLVSGECSAEFTP